MLDLRQTESRYSVRSGRLLFGFQWVYIQRNCNILQSGDRSQYAGLSAAGSIGSNPYSTVTKTIDSATKAISTVVSTILSTATATQNVYSTLIDDITRTPTITPMVVNGY